jgi:hypothetical protein
MKQETVKEVAERYVYSFEYSIVHPRRVAIKSFINGAKWQQDKQDEFAIGFAKWITSEKSKYSILYGNQEKRFATFEEDYTAKELLEIYKKESNL